MSSVHIRPASWRLADPPRRRFASAAAVGLPAAVALGLCLFELRTRSLWLDEAASVAIASQHGGALGSALAHEGGNMLSYYALLHVVVGAFGSGPVAIRLPAALAAVAAVALLGQLALRLFGRRVALLAGLSFAVSLTLVYWGQNARGYTLMVAFICGSFLALVSVLTARGRLWPGWLAYVLLTAAAAYTGLEAVLIVPAQLVVLAWHRDRIRPVLLGMGAVALCCVPLAVLAAQRGSGQLFWVPRPDYKGLKHVVESLASSALEPNFYTGSGPALVWLTLAMTLAGAIRVCRHWAARRLRPTAWPEILLLAWLVIPFVFTVVISEVGQSVFEARYFLSCLPAVALLVAWGLDGLLRPRSGPRALGAVVRLTAVALFAGILALRALQLIPSYGKPSEPWAGVTRYVMAHARTGDCIAFYPLDTRMPFRYYVGPGQNPPAPVLPQLPWPAVRPFIEDYFVPSRAQVSDRTHSCVRVWLVSSHAGEADGTPVSQANYRNYFVLTRRLGAHYASVANTTFGYAGIISVTLFSA